MYSLDFAADAGGQPQPAQQQAGQFAGQYDPQTLASMLQALPQIQQANRRAEALRAVQQHFDQQGQQAEKQGPQNYTPRQMGGLYPTVQRWQPDYAQAGQRIVSALGSAYAQHQANQAEDQYNLGSNAGILPYIQAAASGGGG